MGEVLRARDTRLDREVAVKVLPERFFEDRDRRERFEREAKMLAALSHPNIAAIFAFEEIPGPSGSSSRHLLAMELLDGESLRQRLSGGALPMKKGIEYAIQIAEGLAAAHEKGIVHRDLKPENVFVTKSGRVKILDFGVAKLTQPPAPLSTDTEAPTVAKTEPGVVLGTVAYMSPEQLLGTPLDARSDLFSFGVLLYEMLSGRHPFRGDSAPETMAAILKGEPPGLAESNKNMPPALERIVQHCLEKEPGHRFQSARDIVFALSSLAPEAASRPPVTAAAGPAVPRDDRPSIAVLPFANLSADPEQEYFCDGIAEEILNALAHVHGLRVVARTSSFAFKGRATDIREIGAKLDVAALLEGSVRKAGDRLRITAQLIDVADGSHLWSERYDRRLEDVFAIQEGIALAIVDRLKVSLLGQERAAIERRPTDNLDAYSVYLKGLYYWNKLSPDGFARSRECFEEAIRADPGYVPAHGGLGMWYMSQAFWADLPPQEAGPRCKAAVETALALDPESAFAHVGLGNVLAFFERRWQAAEDALRRGVWLGPSVALGHMNLAALLVARRRWDEAVAEARLSLRLDPLSVPNCAWSAGWVGAAGRHEEARAELERVVAMDPSHWLPHWELCLLAARGGRLEEAVGEGEKAVQLSREASVALALLACCRCAFDDREGAEAVRAQLEERLARAHVPPSFFSWMAAARKESDGATDWLERAAEISDPWLPFYRVIPPALTGSDPRIEALLSRLDL
jgi:serine/threonine-protein kinase